MKFSDIIVKQEIKNRLVQSVRDGRISHAQLFSGEDGGAALPLALAYATYILCENQGTNDSCGECPACLKNRQLLHPDLHFTYPVITSKSVRDRSPRSTDFLPLWRKVIAEQPYLSLNRWYESLDVENKQGFISVEESADILRKLSLKSYEGGYKIQIIWQQEKMRTDASNKLLKIIEEPPDKTLFILVTSNRDQMLTTILSRTQLIKIPSFTVPELAEALTHQFKKSAVECHRAAKLSGGNIQLAIRQLTEPADEQTLESNFINWMRLCYNPFFEKDGKFAWADLNQWIEDTVKSGREAMKQFFLFCLEASRECLLISTESQSLVRFDDTVIPNFSRFSKFIHQGNIHEISRLLNKACYAVERNANPRILLLDLSFQLNRLLNMKMEEVR